MRAFRCGAAPARGGRIFGILLCISLGFIPSPAAAQDPPEGAEGARTPPPEGVTPQIELAILRGLNFLVRTQDSGGSWEAESGTYPVAMTALAGLALLSSGSTPTRGPYSPSIRRAENFLIGNSNDDGLFTTADFREARPMYGHAFTMTFLAQILGQEESLEKQEKIRGALRKAVELTARAQTRNGGWYYQPNYSSDEGTLTVTMMQGLRACRDAGIHVPKEVIDGGVKYIESSANPNGSVRYRLNSSQVRQGVTCAAVVALWSAGRYDDPLFKRIVGYMDRSIQANWGSYSTHSTYVQYYLSQARFMVGGSPLDSGGKRWEQFYRKEAMLLVASQEAGGSWLTQEERSEHGVGRVYSTSVALIVLQLPYNRLPVFQR